MKTQTKPFLFYNQDLTDEFVSSIHDDFLLDIVENGAKEMTLPGYTYYHELVDAFDACEDTIEDVCYDVLGIDWLKQLSTGVSSVNELKGKCVWFAIEQYASQRLRYLNPLPNEVLSGNKPKVAQGTRTPVRN